MNKVLFTLIGLCLMIDISAQRIQGTIKAGSTAQSIVCAIRPSINFSDKPTNLQFTIAVPLSVGARPVMSILNNAYSSFFNNVDIVQTASSATDYIYLINMSGPTLTTEKVFTINAEETVIEPTFTGNIGNMGDIRLMQLENGLATSGTDSENGQYNFYSEFAVAGEKTDTTQMFYSTSGGTVMNAGAYQHLSWVSIGSNAMPLTWLSFSVQKQNQDALIKWDISNSLNNDHFEIERSEDGRSFTSIINIAASDKTSYAYTDNNINRLKGKYVYYRIKQVDKDAKFTYTSIEKLQLTGKDFAFEIVGNPITGNKVVVGIQSASNGNGVLQIIGLNGKKLYQTNLSWLSGYSQNSLNITGLSKGVYIATLTNGNDHYQIRFIK